MKKLIFSIAALAAIVVMGSCSQDSDLTSQKSSSKVDSVTVGLSINTGITVSESNSSMAKSIANVPVTRAAATRADATGNTTSTSSANTNTTKTPFPPTYPSTYTVYFVANGKQGDYSDKEIVYTMNITADNSHLTTATTSSSATPTEVYSTTGIKIPAIKYNVYVTNYTITQTVGSTFASEALPTSSTTLYLNNGNGKPADLTSSASDRTVTVDLINNYAAVAVAANDFVSGVMYNSSTYNTDVNKISDSNYYGSINVPYLNNSSITTTVTSNTNSNVSWNVGGWYYLYINTSSSPTSTKANSTITLQNIAGLTNNTVTLNPTITAGNIYQYTINDNYTGGNGGSDGTIDTNSNNGSGDGLTILVTPFTNKGTSDLSVY
jgi:hypothetical protein